MLIQKKEGKSRERKQNEKRHSGGVERSIIER